LTEKCTFSLLKETSRSNPQFGACHILAFLRPIQTKAALLVEAEYL
jgi:hypothetical protein